MPHAPIFILGANRSGTTLLRLMMNAHPHIGIPEEMQYFHSRYGDVSVHDWRKPPFSPAEYATHVRTYAERAARLHPELNADALTTAILSDGPYDLRRPYRILLETWAGLHGKVRWGEKTPGNVFFVDVLYAMFPEARFVHVVRDPRAGVASMQKVSFFLDDVAFNAMIRRSYADACTHFQTLVPPDQWTTLRYEDLVRAPEKTLRTLLAFLDEPYDPQVLHFHQTADRYMKDDAAATFNARATRPVSTASLDRWKDTLASEEVALVETVCAEEMERYAYTPTAVPLPWNRRVSLGAKSAYWMLQMWRNRDDREHLVRYLPFARLRSILQQARRRMLPAPLRPSSTEM